MAEAYKNLRSETLAELKQANNAFALCFAHKFMPAWSKGENIQLTEVCSEEYERMQELDGEVFAEKPAPKFGSIDLFRQWAKE